MSFGEVRATAGSGAGFEAPYDATRAVSVKDPLWRKVMGCLPVISLIMQGLNRCFAAKQIENNVNSAQIVRQMRCYDICAVAGHMLTVLAIAVFVALAVSNPLTLILSLCTIVLYAGAAFSTVRRLQGAHRPQIDQT